VRRRVKWLEELIRAVRDVVDDTSRTARLCAVLLCGAVAGAVFLVVLHAVRG
jgi:hypothetical protein